MRSKKFWDSVLLETFEILYRCATPPASFKVLYEAAPLNKDSKKVIDYMGYYLSESMTNEILQRQIKKYHLKGYEEQSFRCSVLLGPSPRSIWDPARDSRWL